MTKYKFKASRRIYENVWIHKKLTPKQNTIVWKLKRNTNRKQSDFSKRLQHTKKLSIFYGNLPINKIQHNQTYTYLDKQKSLLFNLETRLDVLLVRANFCCTLFTARQLIMHRKICVNSQIVNMPSFSVANGDIISLSRTCREFIKSIISRNQSNNRKIYTKASHLEINYKTLSAVLLYEPCQIKFPYKIELDLI